MPFNWQQIEQEGGWMMDLLLGGFKFLERGGTQNLVALAEAKRPDILAGTRF